MHNPTDWYKQIKLTQEKKIIYRYIDIYVYIRREKYRDKIAKVDQRPQWVEL